MQGITGARIGSPVAPAAVQKSKASSASEGRGFGGRRTRGIGRLGLQLVLTDGQGSFQGSRRGIQHRCGQCQGELNASGR